jgi:DNA uptake protein ComE-like DNA-binding protein
MENQTMSKSIHPLLCSLIAFGALMGLSPEAHATEIVPVEMHPLFAAVELDGKLNVNSASQGQWELLPGIGPATARKLVAYTAKRKLTQTNQVMRIKGIGRKTFGAIKQYLTLQGETSLAAAR